MAATIPTQIPAQLVAGDTATWKITLSDYRAGEGWALSYAFLKLESGLKIEIPSSASGDDHFVNANAATTANWTPGEYSGRGFVAKDSDRFTIWQGTLLILPNYAGNESPDVRSQARKILDAIEAAILKVATAQSSGKSGGIVEWSAEGLSIKRSSPEALLMELTKQRDRYAAIVNHEQALARRNSGRATGRRILYQFVSPR